MTVAPRRHFAVELCLHLHHTTPRALLVSQNGDEDRATWLPRALIAACEETSPGTVELTVPEWLALERGFI